MNSLAHGNSISEVEITNISNHGVWLYSHGKELFMSYDDFPWFKDQTIKSIINVEEQAPGHFYWPDLDVDLSKKMIESPKKFPLIAK